MPLFYKDDQSVKEEVWFPPKCRTESFDREANGWNLRHTELFVDDWTSEASMVSWNGSQAGTSPQCDGLVELKYHAREDVAACEIVALRLGAEELRAEFEALSKKWYRDTRHLSVVSRKVVHPAYLRIIGMGEAAIPLLLEALRDKPSHWFVALRATTNTDPSPVDSNPSEARDAWLKWGRSLGYID
jgi:hypothetical protein